MNPSSPRCQIEYLKWICNNARMDITQTASNNFILPDSYHVNAELPPIPYLIVAKDAFVSLCGQIANSCGVVHTTANCQAPGYRDHAIRFYYKCANRKMGLKVFCRKTLK